MVDLYAALSTKTTYVAPDRARDRTACRPLRSPLVSLVRRRLRLSVALVVSGLVLASADLNY